MRLTESTTLYVASATQETTPMSLAEVMNAVKGGSCLEELGVYTVPHEADAYHERSKLLADGTEMLNSLGLDNLQRVVELIKDRRLEELLDKCGV